MGYRTKRHLLKNNDLWLLSAEDLPKLPSYAKAELLYQGQHTRIWKHPDVPGVVSKVAFLQTVPRDVLRKYVFCQARREVEGTRILNALGLKTPSMLGHGFTLAPWSRPESILFMAELAENRTLRAILRNCTDRHRRQSLLRGVAEQLAVIYRFGFHHKDCHFENILCTSAGEELIWIDNDIRHSSRKNTVRVRFLKSMQQVFDTSHRYVAPAEWREFIDILRRHLRRSELGEYLADVALPGLSGRP